MMRPSISPPLPTTTTISFLPHMCSVLHNPIPWAPCSKDLSASLGVSAFAHTYKWRRKRRGEGDVHLIERTEREQTNISSWWW